MQNSQAGNETTVIGSYGIAIYKALTANGYEADDIYAAAGIDHVPTNDPLDRLTTTEVTALFREAVQRTGNPAFGLTVARFVHPSALHGLGYSLLASSTLRDCCERMAYYFRLASENARLELVEEGDCYCINTCPLSDSVSDETLDCWHAFVVRLFRLIYAPDLAPVSVSLTRACPPGYEDHYRRSFNTNVIFDSPVTRICLDASIVDEELTGGNREIAHHNDQIIESYLATLDELDIVARVKRLIIDRLGSENCTRAQIAAQLAMSASALQQKLAKKGTSFQALLGEARKTLALRYLEQSRMSITEISFMLGFNDTSSFNRAFKRWTGKAPSEFRGAS